MILVDSNIFMYVAGSPHPHKIWSRDWLEGAARNALHAAVYRFYDAEAICSYDRHYDLIEGLRRIEPDS